MWVSLPGHWEGWGRANNELGEANRTPSIWTFLACGNYYSSDPLFALAFMCKILSSFVSLFLKWLFLTRAECSEDVICADHYLKTFSYLHLDSTLKRKVLCFPIFTPWLPCWGAESAPLSTVAVSGKILLGLGKVQFTWRKTVFSGTPREEGYRSVMGTSPAWNSLILLLLFQDFSHLSIEK